MKNTHLYTSSLVALTTKILLIFIKTEAANFRIFYELLAAAQTHVLINKKSEKISQYSIEKIWKSWNQKQKLWRVRKQSFWRNRSLYHWNDRKNQRMKHQWISQEQNLYWKSKSSRQKRTHNLFSMFLFSESKNSEEMKRITIIWKSKYSVIITIISDMRQFVCIFITEKISFRINSCFFWIHSSVLMMLMSWFLS